jgi:hypothetical protein
MTLKKLLVCWGSLITIYSSTSQAIFKITLPLTTSLVLRPFNIMSQVDIDELVESAYKDTLLSGAVTRAVAMGIPVNGRSRMFNGSTALHWAVVNNRRELVAMLLAAGADANFKNNIGMSSVWAGATYSTADILQLLIDGGGSVNEVTNFGETPLIALVKRVTSLHDCRCYLRAPNWTWTRHWMARRLRSGRWIGVTQS